jgi:hypothetical protein
MPVANDFDAVAIERMAEVWVTRAAAFDELPTPAPTENGRTVDLKGLHMTKKKGDWRLTICAIAIDHESNILHAAVSISISAI